MYSIDSLKKAPHPRRRTEAWIVATWMHRELSATSYKTLHSPQNQNRNDIFSNFLPFRSILTGDSSDSRSFQKIANPRLRLVCFEEVVSLDTCLVGFIFPFHITYHDNLFTATGQSAVLRLSSGMDFN